MLGWYNGSNTSRGHYYYQGMAVGTYNLNGGDLTGNDPSGGYYGGLEVVGIAARASSTILAEPIMPSASLSAELA